MAKTLALASDEGAFALCDRATYLALQKDLKLAVVFQGDAALRNTYAVIEPKGGTGNVAGPTSAISTCSRPRAAR